MNVTNLINLSQVEFPDFWKTHKSPLLSRKSLLLKNTNSYFVAKGFQTFHSITFGAFEALSKNFCILQKSLHKSCAINVTSWSRFSLTKYTQCVLFEIKLPIRMLMAKALWCRMIIDGTWAVCSHDWCDQCVTLHCTRLLIMLHYNGLYVSHNGF